MNAPLIIRRLRDTAKEAGLAGPDPLSKHTQALTSATEVVLAATKAVVANQGLGGRRRDWLIAAIVASTVLTSVLLCGYAGYRWGRASLEAECAQRTFRTQSGVACLMWPSAEAT